MSKQLPQARETALRYIEKLRAELNGQTAPDSYFAEKAARYVGATTAVVLGWMRAR